MRKLTKVDKMMYPCKERTQFYRNLKWKNCKSHNLYFHENKFCIRSKVLFVVNMKCDDSKETNSADRG